MWIHFFFRLSQYPSCVLHGQICEGAWARIRAFHPRQTNPTQHWQQLSKNSPPYFRTIGLSWKSQGSHDRVQKHRHVCRKLHVNNTRALILASLWIALRSNNRTSTSVIPISEFIDCPDNISAALSEHIVLLIMLLLRMLCVCVCVCVSEAMDNCAALEHRNRTYIFGQILNWIVPSLLFLSCELSMIFLDKKKNKQKNINM